MNPKKSVSQCGLCNVVAHGLGAICPQSMFKEKHV